MFKEEEIQRVSRKRLSKMVQFLYSRGYKMTLFFATNKKRSILIHDNYTINFFDNYKLYEYLSPLYEDEQKKEYKEYLQSKMERLRNENNPQLL